MSVRDYGDQWLSRSPKLAKWWKSIYWKRFTTSLGIWRILRRYEDITLAPSCYWKLSGTFQAAYFSTVIKLNHACSQLRLWIKISLQDAMPPYRRHRVHSLKLHLSADFLILSTCKRIFQHYLVINVYVLLSRERCANLLVVWSNWSRIWEKQTWNSKCHFSYILG